MLVTDRRRSPTPAELAAIKATQVANDAARATYNASLPGAKQAMQLALDAMFDAQFDLKAFIRGGTISTVTAVQVGSFLAQITNNYRSLRSQISAATTVAQVQAININAGWPANP